MTWHAIVRYTGYGVANKVVGCDENAADEENGGGDAVVHAEHHVVYDRFVDEVPHLHEARHRGDHAENRHLDGLLVLSVAKRLVQKR